MLEMEALAQKPVSTEERPPVDRPVARPL